MKVSPYLERPLRTLAEVAAARGEATPKRDAADAAKRTKGEPRRITQRKRSGGQRPQ